MRMANDIGCVARVGMCLALAATLGAADRAAAQAPAYGTGASAVTQHTETAAAARPSTDSQSWTIGAGLLWNAGNTQSVAANVGTNLGLVRGRHGLTFLGQFNIGAADATPYHDNSTGYALNSKNMLVRARYDLFLTQLDALYFGTQYRNDRFAGLDLRQDYQFGYQRNFYRTDKHRFWGEVGIDYTHDNVHIGASPGYAPHPNDPLMRPYVRGCSGDICSYVSARAFLGYDNRINEHVSLLTGFEALFNLMVAEDIRFNWLTAVQARVSDRLALEFKFRYLFDNDPVPGHFPNDMQTILSLVVTALK